MAETKLKQVFISAHIDVSIERMEKWLPCSHLAVPCCAHLGSRRIFTLQHLSILLPPAFAKYLLTAVGPVISQERKKEVKITINQGYNNFKTKAFSLFFPHSVSKYTFPAHYCKSFEFQHTMSPAL